MILRERERVRRERQRGREEVEEEQRREAEEKRQLDEAIRISQQDYATRRKEDKLIQEALLASRQEFDEETQLKSGQYDTYMYMYMYINVYSVCYSH